MYKGYSWSCSDVLTLLNVSFNPGKEEQTISCPFCGSKRFGMNIKKGTGHCFKCTKSADSASYYAATTGLSLNDARNDIRKKLNIPDENGNLPKRMVFKEKEQEKLAPIEVRDKTYRAFLDELMLSQKNFDNLKARGFTDDDITAKGYKTFPSVENISFEDLCRRLTKKGCILSGVPGFYKNHNGEWTFVRITPGIIIPQIGIYNQIEGFQIRKDDDLRREYDGELEAKIVWFSSKDKSHGTSSHVSVHIATDFIYNKDNSTYEPVLHGGRVTLTEGGMKADLCACLLDNQASLIAVQGVHSLTPLKEALISLKKYGLTTVNVAFDMDYLTNPNVKEAMKKTVVLIKELGLSVENLMNWKYRQKDEHGNTFFLKGLDDYLAFQQRGIKPVIVKDMP